MWISYLFFISCSFIILVFPWYSSFPLFFLQPMTHLRAPTAPISFYTYVWDCILTICLNRDVFWVWVVSKVRAKVWDLQVENVLEKWPSGSESGHTSTCSTTPKNQVRQVGGEGLWVDRSELFNGLIYWASDVLDVSGLFLAKGRAFC